MSNLNADFGIVLSGAVKEYGVDKPHVFRIDDSPNYKKQMWDDRWVVEQIRELLRSFDILFTWNGSRFDIPFLNSRLLLHGLEPLPKKLHKDLLYTARYGLHLHSNRLASVQEFLGLAHEKSSISGTYWTKALTGDRDAMDYIIDHMERDVLVTEEVMLILKPLIKEIKA